MMLAAEHAERKPVPWTLIFLAVALIAVGAAWLLLPLREWLAVFEKWITGLGIWGVALFALVYILATISLAPEWPADDRRRPAVRRLGFSSHPRHRDDRGLAGLSDSSTFRARQRSLLQRRPIFSAIDDAVAEEGWKVVALLRLSPAVPFNLQNCLFGITAIPFWQFVTATLGGIIPGRVLYVYIGVIGQAAGSGNASGGALKWGFLGIGLLAPSSLSFSSHERR
jgi:uncharacterized membrane protein YdjX (TVP38/TMEM64 family)